MSKKVEPRPESALDFRTWDWSSLLLLGLLGVEMLSECDFSIWRVWSSSLLLEVHEPISMSFGLHIGEEVELQIEFGCCD